MPKRASTNGHSAGSPEMAELAEELAALVREEGLHQITVKHESHYLRLRRRAPARPAAAHALSDGLPGTVEIRPEDEGIPVTSVVVGLFHSSEPLGARVTKGQVLGFVESMSIKHELRAPCEGTLLEVLAEQGEPVEYGQALMLIEEQK